jgi:hypothetical protein
MSDIIQAIQNHWATFGWFLQHGLLEAVNPILLQDTYESKVKRAEPVLPLSFITIPSRIPVEPKLPENSLGSTLPGNWKDTVKGPDGHRCWVCVWNTRDLLKTFCSPVVVVPLIMTLPSHSTSQLNSRWSFLTGCKDYSNKNKIALPFTQRLQCYLNN